MMFTSISLSVAYLAFTYLLLPVATRFMKPYIRRYLLPICLYSFNLAFYLFMAFPKAYRKTRRWLRNDHLYPLTPRLRNELKN